MTLKRPPVPTYEGQTPSAVLWVAAPLKALTFTSPPLNAVSEITGALRNSRQRVDCVSEEQASGVLGTFHKVFCKGTSLSATASKR